MKKIDPKEGRASSVPGIGSSSNWIFEYGVKEPFSQKSTKYIKISESRRKR